MEKESLATYIHHLTREDKRCNFTNSAATIRIFVKGHTIAAWIYEKGQQTLADTISKVEKLQVAQLTATLLPSSTVNVMSHEEDHCFQCQESDHIAHHCPYVHCFSFKCNEYGHILVHCLHQIPPSGTPACHHRPKSHTRCHTTSTSHHHHQDRCRHSRSRAQSLCCRYHSHSCHGSYRQHSRSHHRDNRHHHRSTSWCPHSSTFVPAMIPHTADCLHTGTHQLTLRTAADHVHIQHINQVRQPCINLHPIPAQLQAICMTKEIQESW